MSATHILPPDEAVGLITIEEFEAMDLPDTCGWELIDGEVVSVTFPDLDHRDIQHRLYELLKALFGTAAAVRMELPFAANRHNKNAADVGVVDPVRYQSNRKRLAGAPGLVIEVVSRSNREKKLEKLQQRCFEHGCREFWRVYPKPQTVIVTVQEGNDIISTEYFPNDLIAVDLLGVTGQVAVNDIFSS